MSEAKEASRGAVRHVLLFQYFSRTTTSTPRAQDSLFHIIVDTDATAARLMKRLEDEKPVA